MASKTLQTQATKLVKSLLTARRNQNLRAEQKAYEAVRDFCARYGFEMDNVINGATRRLQQSVGAIMNSIV